jgi:hypothetical protein
MIVNFICFTIGWLVGWLLHLWIVGQSSDSILINEIRQLRHDFWLSIKIKPEKHSVDSTPCPHCNEPKMYHPNNRCVIYYD